MDSVAVQTLCRLIGAKCRRIDRDVHELRSLTKQLEAEVSESPDTALEEDTDDRSPIRNAAHP